MRTSFFDLGVDLQVIPCELADLDYDLGDTKLFEVSVGGIHVNTYFEHYNWTEEDVPLQFITITFNTNTMLFEPIIRSATYEEAKAAHRTQVHKVLCQLNNSFDKCVLPGVKLLHTPTAPKTLASISLVRSQVGSTQVSAEMA